MGWHWQETRNDGNTEPRLATEARRVMHTFLDLARGDSNVQQFGIVVDPEGNATFHVIVRETWEEVTHMVRASLERHPDCGAEFRVVQRGSDDYWNVSTSEGIWLDHKLGW